MLFKNFRDDGEMDRLPAIEPMLKRRIDDSLVFPPRMEPHDPDLIIQNNSTTRRYLTRNVFQPSKLHKKESIRESIDSLRRIQYIQEKMSNRAQEISKLTQTAKTEREKLDADVAELDKDQATWRQRNDQSQRALTDVSQKRISLRKKNKELNR